MQLSHQGVSFTGLTGMGGAGASQALTPGWVSEEQLKTVLLLCLAPCLWEAGWGERTLCSHFSRLVLLGTSMSLVPTPLLLYSGGPGCSRSSTPWAPHFLEPQSSSTALPQPPGALGAALFPRDGQRASGWVSLSQSCLLWER